MDEICDLMKKFLIPIILILIFAVFALLLNLQNPGSIVLQFYLMGEVSVPLALVVMIPFIFGLLLGALLMSVSVVRSKMAAGKTKRQLAKVEKEVQSLRSMPTPGTNTNNGQSAALPGES